MTQRLKFVLEKQKTTVEFEDVSKIDDLITIMVYQGYKKIGRYKLSEARLKFK